MKYPINLWPLKFDLRHIFLKLQYNSTVSSHKGFIAKIPTKETSLKLSAPGALIQIDTKFQELSFVYKSKYN